jgi:hypothetical protein
MSDDALSNIIDEAIEAVEHLIDIAQDPEALRVFLAELGWTPQSLPQPFADVASAGTALLDAVTSDSGDAASVPQALSAIRNLVTTINAIRSQPDTAFPAGIDVAAFKQTIGRDLLDYILVEHLLRNRYPLGGLLQLAGIIRLVPTPASGLRQAYTRREIPWSEISDLITDPAKGLREAFAWDTAAPQITPILGQLASLLESYGMQLYYFTASDAQLAFLNSGATTPVTQATGFDLAVVKSPGDVDVAAGVQMLLRPATVTRGNAVALLPYANVDVSEQIALTDTLSLAISGDADLTKGVSLTFAPGSGAQLEGGFLGGAANSPAHIQAELTITPSANTAERVLFGTADGSRLAVDSASVIAGATVVSTSELDAFVELDLQDLHIVVKPDAGDSDSFLASFLGSNGLSTQLSLGLRFSSITGFHFTGSPGLQATIPVVVQLGPISILAISVGVQPATGGVGLLIGATLSGNIGPLTATIDSVGFTFALGFPDPPTGNLGPLDAGFSFLPPQGVGLAVDAASVSGGGFLSFDSSAHQYSGVLQLKFNDLALQAFGLITTQVAGGDGYSLIALIDADFPPVQLGWGFTLNGVGGLLAVHRTASVDALRDAVKSGKVSSILFPTNAITNAAQVLGALDTLFPTAPGRFLFGPMALIGWGTPTVLTASVAIILELPEPIEVILLAKLTAELPTPSTSLVMLNMDALGVLDLTQDELSLDASLFDSKLISFPICGDMALRANWGLQREFLLSIGGFHPQFTPPSDFPSLNRVTINMPSGIVSQLRLAAYLALTSNSVQFGAALDVFIGVSGCVISGHLGFDALLQLNPFHFATDISGTVAVTIGGDDLASVSLDASLSGPAPWNIAGSFKIHIIFFDVHVSFSESWGLSAPSQQTPAIDVGALLNTALADPRNWNSQLPAGLSALVATRQINDASSLFAHPLAFLEVHEQIVPLDLAITHFGEAVPSGATEFSITDFRVGNQSTAYTAVKDDFAAAQFFDLSDSDKLSRPSFERYDAGAIMNGTLVTNGTSFAKTIDYESFFINTPGVVTVDEGVPQPFPWTALPIVMRTGSAALKAISRAGKLRYAAPGNPIVVAEPVFTLASTSTLAAVTTPAAAGTTYSDAAAALKSALAASPPLRDTLQIVASHELIKVAA